MKQQQQQPDDLLTDNDHGIINDDSGDLIDTITHDAVSGEDDDDGDDDDDDGPPLRQVAALACKRIDVGTAVMPKPLFRPDIEVDYDGSHELREAGTAHGEPTRYACVLEREFNAVVVEHHLKWAPLCVEQEIPGTGRGSFSQQQHPAGDGLLPSSLSFAGGGGGGADNSPSNRLGRYDFDRADSIVDWAIERDMKVKGHVLVWAATSPAFLKDLPPAGVRDALRRHIFTTVGHYRGRITHWDVVNEPLSPDGNLADNVFLQKLGPEYIDLAFRWAAEADPNATLYLNENKVEGLGSRKGDDFYDLMKDLKVDRGVPVHGVGLQAHFNAAGTGRHRPPTPWAIKQQIRRLGELGLSVNISELDVRVSQLPSSGRIQTIAQRQIYHDVVAAALSEPAFDGVWLWGFTDRHTWVTHFYYDDEPLVFDEDYERKEAYYGLRDALMTLQPGGRVGGGDERTQQYLQSDVDADGNRWGHLWMQPEPDSPAAPAAGGGGEISGDARPDWEIETEEDVGEETDASITDGALIPLASDDDDSDEEDDGDGDNPPSQSGAADLPPIS